MLIYLLYRIILFTFISIVLGLILGTLMGLVTGVIRRQVKDALIVSIMSAFLGSLLVCMVPSITAPGSLENTTASAGLGVLTVMGNFILMVIGSLFGSLISNIVELKWSWKWIVGLMSVAYFMMSISLCYSYLKYCPQFTAYYCYTP
jgi:uncharacterized membrane protein YraQ (UPF0718 family)